VYEQAEPHLLIPPNCRRIGLQPGMGCIFCWSHNRLRCAWCFVFGTLLKQKAALFMT